jgi:hypothetical protein
MSRALTTLLAFLATAATTLGQLTYVDATDGPTGNTTLADGSPLIATDTTGSTTWRQRDDATFGSSTSVFEGVDPSPEIKTTLTGLTPGASYRIRVHFWDPQSTAEDWSIRARLATTTYSTYAREAAAVAGSIATPLANTLTYATPPTTFGPHSGREMLAADIGTTTADAQGRIEIFIDDLPSTLTNLRTWYDGISHETTAPPPPSDDIVYTDASLSNTTRHDGQPLAPAPQGTPTPDDNWELRLFGNNATVFESNADGPEDAPLLKTTLTGLTPLADYILYAYFWSDGRDWRLKATTRLTANTIPTQPLSHFASTGNAGRTATLAPPSIPADFATQPLITEGNRTLRQAPLGKFTSDSAGNLSVFIDDLALANEANRTWYDGIGHKPALTLAPTADEDNDGLTNAAEATANTDPYLPDSDGDSHTDAEELTAGSDPLDPDSTPPLPGNAIAIAPDGAWTWFNDERAIFHQGSLFAGYVLADGRYGVTRYDPATNTLHPMILSTAASRQQDDHNNPSLTILPDGRLLALYAKHVAGPVFYQRTSLVPLPSSNADWGPEITHTVPASNTYNNTYRLTAESNRIYNFHRSINFNPSLTISEDLGATWLPTTHFISIGTGGIRPYPRYCSNHTDRIDLIYTEGHPRDFNNSIYHLFYQNGAFRKTDGTTVKSAANLPLIHQNGEHGSFVYTYSAQPWGPGQGPDDWIPSARAWTWDVHYGSDGNPVCVFQVQLDNVTGTGWNHDRIYYYYARWTGTQWQKRFIAHAGRPLYSGEDDYAGGITIDPSNPSVIYLSSNAANPFNLTDLTNVPLRPNDRYELWRGTTADGGLTFTWEPITIDSPADNLRPIVPENHGYDRALLWFHGTYTTYTNYNTQVFALLENRPVIRDFQISQGNATLTWTSSPGRRYRIRASADLSSFPIETGPLIPSQGPQTQHTFPIPPTLQTNPKAFFRIEEQ